MSACPYCGSELAPGSKFCANCGAGVSDVPAQQPQQPQQPYYQEPQQQQYYQQPYYQQPVTPVATGGLIAWSIITLLLCTIPGIVALVKTTGINKAVTVEDQEARMKSARTWCIIGKVLGVLGLIATMVAGMAN